MLKNNITNNVYFLDVNDISGYVFEISDFDTSGTLSINPTFDSQLQVGLGLEDVSAVATIDISLSDFNSIFSFQSDSDDLDDLSINDLKFGINPAASNIFSNLKFSYSNVVSGNVNNYYTSQEIYRDYVRNLAFQITGGYSAADIFTNEEQLVTGVKDLDTTFSNGFNVIINSLIQIGYVSIADFNTSSNPSVLKAALALFTLNLNSGNERTTQLLSDIQEAGQNSSIPTSVGPITVPIKFHEGDKIALRLVYKNANTTFAGNSATIESRSYKILLNLVA